MPIRNKSKVKGNNNITTQIETQNVYYQMPNSSKAEYVPDERASKLLKETIEDESNNFILYVETLSGRTIQCGQGRFTVNSEAIGEKDMTYWEDSFNNLIKNDFIGDVGNKGEVFKILKKGYEYYDKNIKENDNDLKNNNFKFNKIHINILKMFRKNDYNLWDSQLVDFFKDIDNEIAFNELLENNYIENGLVFTAENGGCYNINYSKKMEILKILKEEQNK